MQYYTAQQLRGAARYKPAVLIGNWNEVQISNNNSIISI